MLLHVRRVVALPGGVDVYLDELPDSVILWIRDGLPQAEVDRAIEQALSEDAAYWVRRPVLREPSPSTVQRGHRGGVRREAR